MCGLTDWNFSSIVFFVTKIVCEAITKEVQKWLS